MPKVLSFGDSAAVDYTPSKLMKKSRAELEKEYTHLQKIVNTRIDSMLKTEYAEEIPHKKMYNKDPGSMSAHQLRSNLSNMAHIATSNAYTVAGQERHRSKWEQSMLQKIVALYSKEYQREQMTPEERKQYRATSKERAALRERTRKWLHTNYHQLQDFFGAVKSQYKDKAEFDSDQIVQWLMERMATTTGTGQKRLNKLIASFEKWRGSNKPAKLKKSKQQLKIEKERKMIEKRKEKEARSKLSKAERRAATYAKRQQKHRKRKK